MGMQYRFEEASDQGASPALSVTDAMAMAKGSLEGIVVTIVGEVSELSNKPGYKAVYFTVKDQSSSLPCMMWMNRFKAAQVDMQIGSLVQMTGRFTLYMAKGRMNFDVFSISLAGEGNLRLKVANLAKKLQSEGLMEASRKRALPAFPERIGLVTSPRGAAVHDVLRTLKRRYPLARVLLAGVPVEGANAPQQMIEAMKTVIAHGAEVVLLVRGGGSFEDLMPFNDEALARFIASAEVPVATGIGHEPDNSIADMVADRRMSTPTACAESAAPSLDEVSQWIDASSARLRTAMADTLSRLSMRVERASLQPIFRDPMRLFSDDAQMLDDLSARLSSSLPDTISAMVHALDVMEGRMSVLLQSALEGYRAHVGFGGESLKRVGQVCLSPFSNAVAIQSSRLEDLSPLGVIARGYAICGSEGHGIIKSIGQTAQGQSISVTLSDGILDCTVDSIERVELDMESIVF